MSRARTLTIVGALLALPLVVAAVHAVIYDVRNRDTDSILVDGVRRGFVLHVPPSYDARRGGPLVISLHAAALWGAAQAVTSQWDRVADREGFIVVYPSALGPGLRVWHAEQASRSAADVRFIAALIDTLRARYRVDATRVYVNGMSNGGGMSFTLSCVLADRIAAVGLVASAQTLSWKRCADARPMPMIAFHGTADPDAPYAGGESFLSPRPWPAMRAWVAKWAKRNRCDETPVDTRVAVDVVKREYVNCADAAPVVFYTIENGGHTWPGGTELPAGWVGRTARSVDAAEGMWGFFREHPLGGR